MVARYQEAELVREIGESLGFHRETVSSWRSNELVCLGGITRRCR